MKKKYLILSLLSFSLTSLWATVFTPLPTDISESPTIYNQGTVNLLRVDAKTVIGQGPCIVGNYVGCTLEDINNDLDGSDDFKPEIKVHFSADDFPDDGQVSNASMRLRGATSRFFDLKSYRIKLDSKKKLWRGERKLQLNKHMGDMTRVKNKLSFDLMSTIPHITSLRTQFVNLYVDNEDFGLFTHVEYVGKEYLKRRGYDKDSNVYKAENFEFRVHPELAIDANGQPLDIKAFETILDQKRGDDSKKLLEMLNALNDTENDFQNDVLNKYFNINNILTWEAINILMGNTDITTSNFYIFNPKGKDTFYILPWDYDQSWGFDREATTLRLDTVPAKSSRGPHNFWATKLGERFLSQPGSIELLKSAVEEIKNNYLTKSKIKTFIDSYHPVVFPQVSKNPDFDYLDFAQGSDELTLAAYNELYNSLPDTVEANYQQFLKDLNSPMPFWVDTAKLVDKNISITWNKSFDLQGNDITYDLEIASTPEFKASDIKYSIKKLKKDDFSTTWMLPKGTYYLRITARDNVNPQENWQYAFNEFYDETRDKIFFGVDQFTINVDGEVEDAIIKIDGNQDDWQGKLIFSDANDIKAKHVVDWRQGGFEQDSNNLYLAYVNDDAIDKDNLWAWHVFLNTDNNVNTGFDDGYDYVLEGDELWRYTGTGDDWKWTLVSTIESAVNGSFAEFKIPKNLLNNSSNFEIFFYGSNKYLKKGTPSDYMIGN